MTTFKAVLIGQPLEDLLQAMDGVERLGICGIDVDMPCEEEHEAIRRLIVVMQVFARGYEEDGSQPRLSALLRAVLSDESYVAPQSNAK